VYNHYFESRVKEHPWGSGGEVCDPTTISQTNLQKNKQFHSSGVGFCFDARAGRICDPTLPFLGLVVGLPRIEGRESVIKAMRKSSFSQCCDSKNVDISSAQLAPSIMGVDLQQR
jgi:hypothetical protein